MQDDLTFDEKFKALEDYYAIESPAEIRKQLEKNENIFVLLDRIRPLLEDSFRDADYVLEINFEPETDDKFVILRLNVSEERFNNSVFDEIRALNLKIWDLRKNISVFRDLSIMPGIKDV